MKRRGMVKTSKDFKNFQRYFLEYQKLFGLTGYTVYFKYEPLEEAFASISVNQTDMVATVRLNSKLLNKDKPYKNIRKSAKHEALHLLLHRLEALATYRYSTEAEIIEACEELVHKLALLIKEK